MDEGNECSFCGLRSPDLQRCSRCKGEWYCSRDCQRKHWKGGHKTTCLTGTGEAYPIGRKYTEECRVCGNLENSRLCTGCWKTWYCSSACQGRDWPTHRQECGVTEEGRDVEADWEDSLQTEFCPDRCKDTCHFCGKPSDQLKKCSGCSAVLYCSRKCQRSDWTRRHKTECSKTIDVDSGIDNELEEREAIYDRAADFEKDADKITRETCSLCGVEGQMKTCNRCRKQKYCSEKCQKKDWKRHKSECSKADIAEELSPICAHCKCKNNSLVCSQCRAVYYCSQSCQSSDWKKHKMSCRGGRLQTTVRETLSDMDCYIMGLVKPEEQGGRNRNDIIFSPEEIKKYTEFSCNRCKSAAGNVLCPNCRSVVYCSEICRELDKSKHSTMCTNLQMLIPISEQKIFFTIGGDIGSKGSKGTMVSSPSHAQLSLQGNPAFFADGADMNLIIERTANACAKAIEKTKREFARYTLITRVKEIPVEQKGPFASNICAIPNVFLAYIRRFHSYRGRHNVFLQDSERREIYVSFYLPNDDPTPYFKWEDIVPGKFIAILFPCIHFFADSTVGLRVDKAKHVYCFDVQD
ncbi:uncharacterized protein LOC125680749 isoform X2 [Ostrea edulis]|uniref:uncharacterized protein LOC125680749 isoform X2 n=1 Tax=Ostrea edulis TaxID=37623 RepID=UPI0024AEA8F0|nr:uncharacterized protein LOC125680749 isoform X2 [Ostrea edulis]XP_056009562.1 uncharacterized protein LOC125680749 isoform X2 [Ostrea edulis]